MGFHDRLANAQPQARPPRNVVAPPRFIDSKKTIEHLWQMIGCDAHAVVFHAEVYRAIGVVALQLQKNDSFLWSVAVGALTLAASGGELDGIVEQVVDHLPQ